MLNYFKVNNLLNTFFTLPEILRISLNLSFDPFQLTMHFHVKYEHIKQTYFLKRFELRVRIIFMASIHELFN